jgi:hypothetical protein
MDMVSDLKLHVVDDLVPELSVEILSPRCLEQEALILNFLLACLFFDQSLTLNFVCHVL